MTWARLDDRFHDHRKVTQAWLQDGRAVGLHVMAITYCAGHETDGLVDEWFVATKLPVPKERLKVVGVLIAAGLWSKVDGGGWRIKDYLDYNPSKAEQDEKRAALSQKRAQAGRKGALAKLANAKQTPSKLPGLVLAKPSPDPTRTTTPPLTPPGGNRKRDRLRHENGLRSLAAAVFGDACTDDHAQAVKGAWNHGARDKAAVLAWIAEWRPDLLDGAA